MQDELISAIYGQKIPNFVFHVSERLLKNGYQVFIVGGALRDAWLGCQAKDWDLTTNATPEKVGGLFPELTGFYLKHGTVTLVFKEGLCELTTFRGMGGYGTNILEDLARRDFTFNAFAYDIFEKRIIDPFGGKRDLKDKIVRAVENPKQRFDEDPLRMMRAIRFSLHLGFSIDPETLLAIQSRAKSIDKAAPERIRDELLKILITKKPSGGFNLMRKTGLLGVIIPELLEGYRKRQNDYHKYTIFRHIMTTLDSIDNDPILRLAALFHDIAKPRVRKKINNRWTFFNHSAVGSALAREIMVRLRFKNDWISQVTELIHHHMFDYKQNLSDHAMRRLIRVVGIDNINNLIILRRADEFAHGQGTVFEKNLERFKGRVEEVRKKSMPLAVSALAVGGHEVMNLLGLPPGPRVGEILNELVEVVIKEPEYNQKEKLLEILKDKMG